MPRNRALWACMIGGLLCAAGAASPNENVQEAMAKRILVHITHGPEHPTRAALGFAVAAAALEQGHQVTVFLAGDGVQLMRAGVVDHMQGLGTGNLRELHTAVAEGGATFYLSGGSSAARGLDADQIVGPPIQMAGPARLVELSLEADRMFVY